MGPGSSPEAFVSATVHHRVFVYGTLLRGEVNHHRLARAELLGACRTQPCFTLFHLGAYPGLGRGGRTAIAGEVYEVDGAGLRCLDRLEEYPRLYDRKLIPTPFGRAWVYLYRGDLGGRPVIQGGDWRGFAADPDSYRAAGIRGKLDPKNRPRARARAGETFMSEAAPRTDRVHSHPRPGVRFGQDAIASVPTHEEGSCLKKAVSPSILSSARAFRSTSSSTGSGRPMS